MATEEKITSSGKHRACDWLNAKNVEVYCLEERLLLAKALIYVKKSTKCSWFVCPHCKCCLSRFKLHVVR